MCGIDGTLQTIKGIDGTVIARVIPRSVCNR